MTKKEDVRDGKLRGGVMKNGRGKKKRSTARKQVLSDNPDAKLLNPSCYDDAIIGIAYPMENPRYPAAVAVYDRQKLTKIGAEQFKKRNPKASRDEAMEQAVLEHGETPWGLDYDLNSPIVIAPLED